MVGLSFWSTNADKKAVNKLKPVAGKETTPSAPVTSAATVVSLVENRDLEEEEKKKKKITVKKSVKHIDNAIAKDANTDANTDAADKKAMVENNPETGKEKNDSKGGIGKNGV